MSNIRHQRDMTQMSLYYPSRTEALSVMVELFNKGDISLERYYRTYMLIGRKRYDTDTFRIDLQHVGFCIWRLKIWILDELDGQWYAWNPTIFASTRVFQSVSRRRAVRLADQLMATPELIH